MISFIYFRKRIAVIFVYGCNKSIQTSNIAIFVEELMEKERRKGATLTDTLKIIGPQLIRVPLRRS